MNGFYGMLQIVHEQDYKELYDFQIELATNKLEPLRSWEAVTQRQV
jgi:hypothetical protein